jgi:hypothetical protein
VNHIKRFFINAIDEDPSPMGNFLAGVFQVLLGFWILLPQDSFGPVLFAEDTPVFSHLQEHHFAFAILALGIFEITAAMLHKWPWLQHESIIAAMFWTFVTVGYVLALPTSTNIVIFGFFATFNAYKYALLSRYCYNLRNKQSVGII